MCVSVGGGQMEKRESQADSVLSAEPNSELDLMILRSWLELKSRVRWLTNWATQVALKGIFETTVDKYIWVVHKYLFMQINMYGIINFLGYDIVLQLF